MAPNIKQSLSLFTSPSNASRRKIKKRHTTDENHDDTIDTLPGDPVVKTKLWSATTVGTIGRNGPPMIKPNSSFVANAAGAIGPTALLVGGTAAMYSSLLNHPSSTLTPLSILYMLLLAIQTSVQPRLSRRYIPKKVSKVKVALVEEVIKTSVASVLFWKWSSQNVIKEALKDWTLSSSLLVAGIPATLYAVQGVLTYLSHQHLDSVTFNGLSQTKTLTAALCCYLVMGKRQSPLQIVALALLFTSAFVFQNMAIGLRWARGGEKEDTSAMALTTKQVAEDDTISSDEVDSTDNDSRSSQETATTNPQPVTAPLQARADPSSAQATACQQADRSFLFYGVLPCLGATFLSGLAGAFSQRGLQIVGGSGRNAFLYTVEVSFFSAMALLVSEGVSMLKRKAAIAPQNSDIGDAATQEVGVEASTAWPWQTYIPIACKAMGGILTALVHKHAGSVVKGFALMLGLVMSGILQSLWLDTNGNQDAPSATQSRLPVHQVIGIVIVMFSSWLHFTNPPS